MKKRFFKFGLLLFLVMFYNVVVLEAADVTNPVKLNVNAKKITNRMYYTNKAGVEVPVNLGWTEKLLVGETGEIAITITIAALPTEPKTGDLIVKVDQVRAVVTAFDDGGLMSIESGWLKYDYTNELTGSVGVFTDNQGITNKSNKPEVVKKADITTLCLLTDVSPTTTYLFNYYSELNLPGHIIFTAILVDDVSLKSSAQVLGVDVQTIYFNYPGLTTKQNHAFWLNLIVSDFVPD